MAQRAGPAPTCTRWAPCCTSSSPAGLPSSPRRSEEHTSELHSHHDLVCRLLLEKKKKKKKDLLMHRKENKPKTTIERSLFDIERIHASVNISNVSVRCDHNVVSHTLYPLCLRDR